MTENTTYDDTLILNSHYYHNYNNQSIVSLYNYNINKEFAAKHINNIAEIINETTDYKIVRTGDNEKCWIFSL